MWGLSKRGALESRCQLSFRARYNVPGAPPALSPKALEKRVRGQPDRPGQRSHEILDVQLGRSQRPRHILDQTPNQCVIPSGESQVRRLDGPPDDLLVDDFDVGACLAMVPLYKIETPDLVDQQFQLVGGYAFEPF